MADKELPVVIQAVGVGISYNKRASLPGRTHRKWIEMKAEDLPAKAEQLMNRRPLLSKRMDLCLNFGRSSRLDLGQKTGPLLWL
jgi:hypothetical protein